MQTYGQATHLGYLQLTLDGQSGSIKSYDGKLIPVDPSRWKPDPGITGKLDKYRSMYPEIMVTVGKTAAQMNRRYIEESDVGNLFADIFVEASGADIGFVHGGSLRKDIPAGDVRMVDILDTYPFVDDVIIKRMTGDQIRRALEQSLTFERGLLQLSGLELNYDLRQPEGQRIVSLKRNGRPVMPGDQFTIAAPGFLTEGGDLYDSFSESAVIGDVGKVADIVIQYFRSQEVVTVPKSGRQKDVTPTN
jgi:2',3'-cyclic-nucleotide 2'-phosphodiesterase (5'-nucleotidase family)